jgi:hypothetical protein
LSIPPVASRRRRDPACRLMGVVAHEGRELPERLCERMTCRTPFMRVGTSLGHGTPDNGGHERIAAATSILELTSANAQDQQG